ncbi:MAG: biopolymer transporter ExbD [Burkholderiaceae bacterium]|jgi:biopolymer transport protein ExbD|nr:biopolymer transporter ExbD [Burkholderiaceae bacterium]
MAFSLLDDEGNEEPIVEINMVPLIDVMLVLMVVFMVTAPLLTHAVKLDLPRASSTVTERDAPALDVAIDVGGLVRVDGVPIDAAALPARFAEVARHDPKTELRVRADRRTPYETIARVLSDASRNGLARIGFVTDPRSADEAR